jgi:peptidase E
MMLYLFGGYKENTEKEHWELMMGSILEINPKQILYLGFAENRRSLEEKFKRFLERFPSNHSIEVLDASRPANIAKTVDPLIYVGGGNDHFALISSINNNILSLQLIRQH